MKVPCVHKLISTSEQLGNAARGGAYQVKQDGCHHDAQSTSVHPCNQCYRAHHTEVRQEARIPVLSPMLAVQAGHPATQARIASNGH